MSTESIPSASRTSKGRRPLPEATDYLGKERIAACCAWRRYNLRPDDDEMDELINHAASVYWYYCERREAPSPKAWTAARDRPNDSSLAVTDPHHKHIPPDIKHHRAPAPELSFTRPNLPFLICEIKQLLGG